MTSNPELDDASAAPPHSMVLQLGDIVRIHASSNFSFTNTVLYMVGYIDDTRAQFVNIQTCVPKVVHINNGVIGDGSIESIVVVAQNPERGYARQNGLLPGVHVALRLITGASVPGKIVELEEDQIQIRLDAGGEPLYIDFGYKGLPNNTPIDAIDVTKGVEEDAERDAERDAIEEDTLEEPASLPKSAPIAPVPLRADEIVFGEDINVQEIAVAQRDKFRYTLESQLNDMLESMVSAIPAYARTEEKLATIHQIIRRFSQLRGEYMLFDADQRVMGAIRPTATDRPLATALGKLQNSVSWLKFGTRTIKKVYATGETEQHEFETQAAEDVAILPIGTNLCNMSLIESRYTNNDNRGDQSNYASMAGALHPYMTPYALPPVGSAAATPTLFRGKVGVSMDAIVASNIGKTTATAVHAGILSPHRFTTQQYTLGIDRLEPIPNSVPQRMPMTPNDQMIVQSVLTLPTSAIDFSRATLPGTNILVRANLGRHHLNIWQALQKKTEVTSVPIQDLNTALQYTADNFSNTVRQYVLEGEGTLEEFLKVVVPKTKTLFGMVRDSLGGKLSVVDAVNAMEPFLVYTRDLTFMQYQTIRRFVQATIQAHNRKFKTMEQAFKSITYTARTIPHVTGRKVVQKVPRGARASQNRVVPLMTKHRVYALPEMEAMTAVYGDGAKISGDEFIRCAWAIDGGRVFNATITLLNQTLMFPDDMMEAILAHYVSQTRNEAPAEAAEKCPTLQIAKRYFTKEAMTADNNVEIFFDVEFDATQRRVENGHSALLSTMDAATNRATVVRMIRKNDVWIVEDDEMANMDRMTNCNVKPDCMFDALKDTCATMNTAANTLVKSSMETISEQFDKQYNQIMLEMHKTVISRLQRLEESAIKMHQFQKKEQTKYDRRRTMMGKAAEVEDAIQGIKTSPVSPHRAALDAILRQSNFLERQMNIVRFAEACCNDSSNNSPWLTCKDTDVNLLPQFRLDLANAVFMSDRAYRETLEELIQTRGTKDDTMGTWFDKITGENIAVVDFDTTEGYTEQGFVNKSRSVLPPVDAASISPTERITVDGKKVARMVEELAVHIKVNIGAVRDVIIKIAMDIVSRIEDETEYAVFQEIAKKSGKKIRTYESMYATSRMYATLGAFLVAIQTNVPPLRGSLRFAGYPVEEGVDDVGIDTVAVAAHALNRTKSSVWSAARSLTGIKNELRHTLEMRVRAADGVEQRIQQRREYNSTLLADGDGMARAQKRITTWSQFRPPLVPFHMTRTTVPTPGFISELKKNIKEGSPAQRGRMEIVESRVMAMALEIQGHIQDIVSKQDTLLIAGGRPYMDNACCNQSGRNRTVLAFFTEHIHAITTLNDGVRELSTKILMAIRRKARGNTMVSSVDTRRVYPVMPTGVGVDTIAMAVVDWCASASSPWKTALCPPLAPGETREARMARLKTEGTSFTKEQFMHLQQHMSRVVEPPKSTQSPAQNDVHQLAVDAPKIVEAMRAFLSPNSTPAARRKAQNDLLDASSRATAEIADFVQTHTAMRIGDTLDALAVWREGVPTEDIAGAARNMVALAGGVLPNMTIDPPTQKFKVPTHWKLNSANIRSKLETIMAASYGLIADFREMRPLSNLLSRVITRAKPLLTLVKTAIAPESFGAEDTRMVLHQILLEVLHIYVDLANHADASDLLRVDEEEEYDEEEVSASRLRSQTARFLSAIVAMFANNKKVQNLSPKDIRDKLFRSRETEKNLFTDRLKAMDNEAREVDTVLKQLKLGLYSIGANVRTYNDAIYEHDRLVADQIGDILEQRGEEDLEEEKEKDGEEEKEGDGADMFNDEEANDEAREELEMVAFDVDLDVDGSEEEGEY
jgi:hypothetical protein